MGEIKFLHVRLDGIPFVKLARLNILHKFAVVGWQENGNDNVG